MKLKKIFRITLTIIAVFYPLLIYFGLTLYSLHATAYLIGIVMIVNVFTQERHSYHMRLVIPFLAIMVVYIGGILLNSFIVVLLLPFLISCSLLGSFSYSLLRPPSAVEMFARMVIPELSNEETIYCWRVTLLWVCFLGVNAVATFYTACCTSFEAWGLYNGLVAYLGMGMLFVGELSYRAWRFRRYPGLPTDYLFKKLFPPKA